MKISRRSRDPFDSLQFPLSGIAHRNFCLPGKQHLRRLIYGAWAASWPSFFVVESFLPDGIVSWDELKVWQITGSLLSHCRPSTAEINLGAGRNTFKRLLQPILSLVHYHSELDDRRKVCPNFTSFSEEKFSASLWRVRRRQRHRFPRATSTTGANRADRLNDSP